MKRTKFFQAFPADLVCLCLVLSACAAPIQSPPPTEFIPTERTAASVPPAIGKPDLEQPAVHALVLQRLRVSLVGDLMLGGRAQAVLAREGYDYPFLNTREEFAASDIVLANLEGPLTDHTQPLLDKQYVFRSPAKYVAPAMRQAGINMVSLANNHALDYGARGLRDTVVALERSQIGYFGAGEDLAAARSSTIRVIGGFRIGFLGYSLTFPEAFWATSTRAGTAFGHQQHIRQDIAALVSQVDLIVVSFHWGRERTAVLRDYQPKLAHAAIDAGAHLVVGHHPHIPQAVERYRHGIIFYSLGNYAFGSYSPHVSFGLLAHVEASTAGLESAEIIPININNFQVQFRPTPLRGEAATAALQELVELSQQRNTRLVIRGDRAVLTINGNE